MELIAEGAEARVFAEGGRLIKERVPKPYRIKEIDERLRRFRTRREAKVFGDMQKLGIPVPELYSHSDKSMKLEMELLDGGKLRDVLSSRNCAVHCRRIGEYVGLMHSHGIIHADLTTSNMILQKGKIYFIDFGLSFFSSRAEDKAVDIHLFRQALEGRHSSFWKKAYASFLEGYTNANPQHAEVLARLEKVEARGRHKAKG